MVHARFQHIQFSKYDDFHFKMDRYMYIYRNRNRNYHMFNIESCGYELVKVKRFYIAH